MKNFGEKPYSCGVMQVKLISYMHQQQLKKCWGFITHTRTYIKLGIKQETSQNYCGLNMCMIEHLNTFFEMTAIKTSKPDLSFCNKLEQTVS